MFKMLKQRERNTFFAYANVLSSAIDQWFSTGGSGYF